jgi:ribosomal protein L7/L12
MFSIFSSGYFLPSDAQRLRRVEQKLDLILKHLGVDASRIGPGDEPSEDVRQLADADQKIAAIKLLREQTGYGLKQAKDVVEAYMSRK